MSHTLPTNCRRSVRHLIVSETSIVRTKQRPKSGPVQDAGPQWVKYLQIRLPHSAGKRPWFRRLNSAMGARSFAGDSLLTAWSQRREAVSKPFTGCLEAASGVGNTSPVGGASGFVRKLRTECETNRGCLAVLGTARSQCVRRWRQLSPTAATYRIQPIGLADGAIDSVE